MLTTYLNNLNRFYCDISRIRTPAFRASVTFGLMIGILGLTSFGSMAQEATPSQVFQRADNISRELKLMAEVSFSAQSILEISTGETPRRPHHVLQKAREIMVKLQELRWINGLERRPVAATPARQIRPSDVNAVVEDMLKDLRELRTIFRINQEVEKAPLIPGKHGVDVYRKFSEIGLLIDDLGSPATVPNDVNQVAETIFLDMELIRKKLKIDTAIQFESGSKNKHGDDVYTHIFDVLLDVQKLTEVDSRFKVPGGVKLPNKAKKNFNPIVVIDLMNNLLAEVGALKVAVGVAEETKLAPPQTGKTPSHVFDLITNIHKLLITLSPEKLGKS